MPVTISSMAVAQGEEQKELVSEDSKPQAPTTYGLDRCRVEQSPCAVAVMHTVSCVHTCACDLRARRRPRLCIPGRHDFAILEALAVFSSENRQRAIPMWLFCLNPCLSPRLLVLFARVLCSAECLVFTRPSGRRLGERRHLHYTPSLSQLRRCGRETLEVFYVATSA